MSTCSATEPSDWQPLRGAFSGLVVGGLRFFDELGRGSSSVVYQGALGDGSKVALKLRVVKSPEQRNLERIRELVREAGGPVEAFPTVLPRQNVRLGGTDLLPRCNDPLRARGARPAD